MRLVQLNLFGCGNFKPHVAAEGQLRRTYRNALYVGVVGGLDAFSVQTYLAVSGCSRHFNPVSPFGQLSVVVALCGIYADGYGISDATQGASVSLRLYGVVVVAFVQPGQVGVVVPRTSG